MKYIDIHTHHNNSDPSVLSVWNQMMHAPTVIPPHQYFSLSAHPWYVDALPADFMSRFQEEASRKECFAIGECGLDRVTHTPWDVQIDVFREQILWANALNKPLIIHCVRAVDDCLEELKVAENPAIFHGVNFGYEKVKRILDHGHFVSFGKALLNSKMVEDYVVKIPLDRIFLETDDAPLSIRDIYAATAGILKIEEEELSLQIQNNFQSIVT